VIVTADHGEVLGTFDRHHGMSVEETNVAVPLLLAAPGLDGGRSSAALGGRSSTSLGGSSVGGSNEGGDSNVGPSLDCVDLDQNTVPDCSETVAKNSGFDRDVKGWSPEANGAIEWNALDARGSTGSGTMRVENRATIVADNGGLVFSGATQCVSIEATRAYDLFVQMYSRGPTITAYASIVGRVFGSEDCSGAPLRVETSPIQGTIDLWLTLQATVPAVTGAKSLLVELSVGKLSETPGPVSLVFDNVLVR
jgi:hypothetical protein